jgi:hypothetical protein
MVHLHRVTEFVEQHVVDDFRPEEKEPGVQRDGLAP